MSRKVEDTVFALLEAGCNTILEGKLLVAGGFPCSSSRREVSRRREEDRVIFCLTLVVDEGED